ncbi:MAG: GNAT family N-acetyltransferase [Candidatus Melainabacteria bacterium]
MTPADKRLEIRNAKTSDIPAIRALCKRVYPHMLPYSQTVLKGHIHNFPKGQFVAVYGDEIIGYCATIIQTSEKVLKPHTWHVITGGGYGSTHDPEGDFLYGMEIYVDPNYRRLKVGDRLYRARKKLCTDLKLSGIVFGGRMPNYAKNAKLKLSPEDYVERVRQKKLKDPVVNFHFRHEFELLGVLKDYLPSDSESLGYATHMIWRNPDVPSNENIYKKYGKKGLGTVRVATVQYQQRRITSLDEFQQMVTYFVDVVSDYSADFVLFPELFTLQLLCLENEEVAPDVAIEKLTAHTAYIKEFFQALALKYNVNIIAGSHPTKRENGEIHNITYVCLRDGTVHEQAKIHPTPSEAYWWNIEGDDKLHAIDTDCGPIGVLICYDSEFPELARHLVDQGALILFVPFCTDERQAYLRVRYCCQARAVENQCYVVMSGNVGNLPLVHNMDIQYAQSCILTPCDFPFSRDGIAADTTPNVETVAFADLNLESLFRARNAGSVRNLKNRRHDLYGVKWYSEE